MKVTTLENGTPNSAADAASYMIVTTIENDTPAAALRGDSAFINAPFRTVLNSL